MKITTCIFDLDGVIVDTAKYHFIAWRELAGELGFNFSEKHNERLKGVSRMESMRILLEIGGITMDEKTRREYATRKNDVYVGFIKKMTPDEILPGVLSFLDQLKQNNIKTALGSASKNAPLILDRLGLSSYFDAIIDGNKVENAKPDPEVFLKGANETGSKPTHCVVFEDAQAGVQAAINGGMKCIGVGDAAVLNQADFVIRGFEGFNLEKLRQGIAGS